MDRWPGYPSASWEQGYGDYLLKPDLATLRLTPWLEGTATVLCDVLDHPHDPVPHSPRAMLRRQIARLHAKGLNPSLASELEFYLVYETFKGSHRKHTQDLKTEGH